MGTDILSPVGVLGIFALGAIFRLGWGFYRDNR